MSDIKAFSFALFKGGSRGKGKEGSKILALDLESTFDGTDDFFVTSDTHLEVLGIDSVNK